VEENLLHSIWAKCLKLQNIDLHIGISKLETSACISSNRLNRNTSHSSHPVSSMKTTLRPNIKLFADGKLVPRHGFAELGSETAFMLLRC
jgi:hypothetical protein